jgi:hypothetical protein
MLTSVQTTGIVFTFPGNSDYVEKYYFPHYCALCIFDQNLTQNYSSLPIFLPTYATWNVDNFFPRNRNSKVIFPAHISPFRETRFAIYSSVSEADKLRKMRTSSRGCRSSARGREGRASQAAVGEPGRESPLLLRALLAGGASRSLIESRSNAAATGSLL